MEVNESFTLCVVSATQRRRGRFVFRHADGPVQANDSERFAIRPCHKSAMMRAGHKDHYDPAGLRFFNRIDNERLDAAPPARSPRYNRERLRITSSRKTNDRNRRRLRVDSRPWPLSFAARPAARSIRIRRQRDTRACRRRSARAPKSFPPPRSPPAGKPK